MSAFELVSGASGLWRGKRFQVWGGGCFGWKGFGMLDRLYQQQGLGFRIERVEGLQFRIEGVLGFGRV